MNFLATMLLNTTIYYYEMVQLTNERKGNLLEELPIAKSRLAYINVSKVYENVINANISKVYSNLAILKKNL
jgi:hypothetical protein